MQTHVFMPGREQYGFQLHSHGDMLSMGPQQPSPFNGQHLHPDQPAHPYQDGVASCLHEDRHVGFSGNDTGPQHMFEAEFGQLAEAQARDCLPLQQQGLAAGADYQFHGHPVSSHAVPAPCLPLDQSPNRAAPFHGLPSYTPENNSLENGLLLHGRSGGSQYCFPCDPLSSHFDMVGHSNLDSTEPKFPYCEAGSQMAAGRSPTLCQGGSRAPVMGGSKVDLHLPQQNAYSERFVNKGKLEPGLNARHHLMAQQKAGPMARQNSGSPVLPRLYHTPDFVPNSPDIHSSSVVAHAQHGQLDHPMHRLSSHKMHLFGEPVFSGPQLGFQPPHQQHVNSFPYLSVTKRPRFNPPSGSVGESCSPLVGGLHNRPESPSTFPGPMGDFTAHVTDGFSWGPPLLSCDRQQHQPLPHRPNAAALIIKQMASRSQQQRLRQGDLQPVNHHSDGTLNGMVHRGPMGTVSQLNFDKRHNFHRSFEIQSPHLPHENSWFPDPHQQCREANIHLMEQSQNGHSVIFRSGVTTVDMQPLHSPGLHSQFENSINNHLQTSEDGTMQPKTAMDRSQSKFGGPALRRQHGFLPGGSKQQGTPKSNPPGFGSSSENYPSHSEFVSSQHLSVNKLGALSLGNLNKGNTKDSGFGQSCLAALSTACQNMIASLGAPNLNVTFNKKNQNEDKCKPGQVEQDINSGSGGGPCGPGTEYFQSNGSQNSQAPCSGINNTTACQSASGQMVKRELCALSPNHNTDSGNEGKAPIGRGRVKRRRDSGHISPVNFSPSCSSNPVVSPGQHASSLSVGMESQGRTPEGSLISPSFGKADLATSMDSGIQSVGKSDAVSPCMDYDASPNYGHEDARTGRSSMKCGTEGRDGYSDTPCMEQVRTPLGSSAQHEVHPLEILQAQIQLQRQQFSISEDQPLGGKSGRKPDCPSGPSEDCGLASCSPESGKGSVNTIDLDSLMAEQHATWYDTSNKALMDPGNGKCVGFWDRARGQSDNKEGHG
ncbi:transcriptional activator MN1 isoform X2 [Brachyhypopomus gauderio]